MTIKELQKKVDTLLENRAAEIEKLEAEIDEEKCRIKDATAEMSAASDNSDLKAFQQAKKKKTDASDALEMHEARLRKLEEDSISKEEYKQMLSDVKTEMDQEVEDVKPRLVEASDKLAAIGVEISEKAMSATELMQKIQRELYRDQDRLRDNKGRIIGDRVEYKGHYDVCGWSKSGINHFMYGEYRKDEKKA